MIYTGSNEIIDIMLGDTQILGIYAGDLQLFPMGPFEGFKVRPLELAFTPAITSATIKIKSSEEWEVTSYPSWLTLSQESGVSGETEITIETVGEAEVRTATIELHTLNDEYSASVSVAQSICTPIICANHIGERNNRGDQYPNFYILDSGITLVNDCVYDLNGMKSICQRWDSSSFYDNKIPVFSIGYDKVGTSSSLQTVTDLDIDIPTVEVISYPFGNDSPDQVSQSLTSVTMTSTDNVYYFRNVFYYMQNLKYVKLGNLSNVRTAITPIFNNYNNSLTDFYVEALPKLSMSSWGWNYLTNLTEQSVINILNALPSDASGYTITLGTLLNKLVSAEGQAALATARSKGWTIN